MAFSLAALAALGLRADTIYQDPAVTIQRGGQFVQVPLTSAWIPEETARKFCEIEKCSQFVSYVRSNRPIPAGSTVTRANLYAPDDWGQTFSGQLVRAEDRFYTSITCNATSGLTYQPGVVSFPSANGVPLSAAGDPEATARKYCQIERGTLLDTFSVSGTSIPQGTAITRANLESADDWGKIFRGRLDPRADRYFESIACRPPATFTAQPDVLFDLYFTRCGPGWNGGDSTYSAALGLDRVAWMFSDSYVGHVDANGNRRDELDENGHPRVRSQDFVQGNVLVTQHRKTGDFLSYLSNAGATVSRESVPYFTLRDGRLVYDEAACTRDNESPLEAYFAPPSCTRRGCWLWSGDLLVDGGNLNVFLSRFSHADPDHPQPFDWQWEGATIGSVSATELAGARPTYTDLAPLGARVAYGLALLPEVRVGDEGRRFTYVYGHPATPREGSNRCVHLARVPTRELTDLGRWEFWGRTDTGAPGWTSDPARTLPLGPAVSGELSVTRISGCGALGPECFAMIGHEANWLSPWIVIRLAPTPLGPWTGPIRIYSTPESGQDGQLATYNSHAHPAWTSESGELLISYNVIALGEHANPVPLSHYRPHFLRLRIGG